MAQDACCENECMRSATEKEKKILLMTFTVKCLSLYFKTLDAFYLCFKATVLKMARVSHLAVCAHTHTPTPEQSIPSAAVTSLQSAQLLGPACYK